MNLKEVLPRVKKNILLKNYTTLRIGGRAKYFFIAKNREDLIKAILAAQKFKIPFFVLGSGSNVLISDKGFNGLVIKNEARNFEIKGEKIVAESGAILDKVIESAIRAGLAGLEKGSGIPGTIGGAVYGNAGSKKNEWSISKAIESVELLFSNGKIKKVGKKWLNFSYRESRLKKMKKAPVILTVFLKLRKGNSQKLKKIRKEILKERIKRIPPGFSAGSVFKNCKNIPAGKLIEKCGLKGKKVGGVKVSEKHANFIINFKNGKASDVKKLIKLIKKEARKKFGISLKEEIEFINV